MPSSNTRDDLPAHYESVADLRRIARAVIQSMDRVSHRFGARMVRSAVLKTVKQSEANTTAKLPPGHQIENKAKMSVAELRQQLLRDTRNDH